MDYERVTVLALYIIGYLILAWKAPQYVNIYVSALVPVITYYFVKKELEKKVFANMENIITDIGTLIIWLLVTFLAILLFTWVFIHLVVPNPSF